MLQLEEKIVADVESTTANHRMQTASVLFALEQALGAYVVQNTHVASSIPDDLRKKVLDRTGSSDDQFTVAQIVQETYIAEVVDLALAVAQDTADHVPLKKLKQLAEGFGLFDIRNAVCHPNRQFPEYYWYRTAAVATDPVIQQLKLYRVTDAFRCALDDRIDIPPEGWFRQTTWAVPHNLPGSFDHDVTSLIGREQECKDLVKRLRNSRNTLIAVVGPGGMGKTALCLDTLHRASLEPTTVEWTEQIVYVTAKTEQLTARGVESISDPVVSLAQLRTVIGRAVLNQGDIDCEEDVFCLATKEHLKRRLLICIDNLETLLREHGEQFDDFVQDMPETWRVMVTSRVPVNGANVLTLKPIRPPGAMKLARDYLSIRGIAQQETNVEQLVAVCDCNPLAIRLAIDSYAAGATLDTSLSQTKGRILEFSYTSLIEHLSDEAKKVLECLFGCSPDAVTRPEIGHLLGFSPDEVADAVQAVLKTSLVTRQTEETLERYTLSSSVRDLLLQNPINTDVRNSVHERLKLQRRVISGFVNNDFKDPLSAAFIPSQVPQFVAALVVAAKRALDGQSSRAELLHQLHNITSALSHDPNEAVLLRIQGLLLERLGDHFGMVDCLAKATRCAKEDLAARLLLAEALKSNKQLEETVEQTSVLLAQVLDDEAVDTRNKARVLRCHYVSLLWLGRYREVLEATKSVTDEGLRVVVAALRGSALSRFHEDVSQPLSERQLCCEEMLRCFDQAFKLDGYIHEATHEAFRALERLVYAGQRGLLTSVEVSAIAEFIDKHLVSMCGNHRSFSLSDSQMRVLVETFRTLDSDKRSPLSGRRWDELLGLETDQDPLAQAGYCSAFISRVFPERHYAFARATDRSRDFYIPRSATELGASEFADLKSGQLVSVLPDEQLHRQVGRACPVRHAMLAD